MNPHPSAQDELLSAYLDGEVSDAERREVEARLAADPAAQRLLTDLRGAAAAVRGLPRGQAPAGLSLRIAQQLERATLLGDPPIRRIHAPARTGWVVWSQRLSYAAVIFMTVGIGFVYLRFAPRPYPVLHEPKKGGTSADGGALANKSTGRFDKKSEMAEKALPVREPDVRIVMKSAEPGPLVDEHSTKMVQKKDAGAMVQGKSGAVPGGESPPVQIAAIEPSVGGQLAQSIAQTEAVPEPDAATLLVNVSDVSQVGRFVNEVRLQAAALKIPPATPTQNFRAPQAAEQTWIQTLLTPETRPAPDMVQSSIDVCAPVDQLETLVSNMSQAPAALGCSIEFNALGQTVNSWTESKALVMACGIAEPNVVDVARAPVIGDQKKLAAPPMPAGKEMAAPGVPPAGGTNEKADSRSAKLNIGAKNDTGYSSDVEEQTDLKAQAEAKSRQVQREQVMAKGGGPRQEQKLANDDDAAAKRGLGNERVVTQRGGGDVASQRAASQWIDQTQYRLNPQNFNDRRARNAILRITVQAPAANRANPTSTAPR